MGEKKPTPGPWCRAELDPFTIEREGAPICVVHSADDFPCWDGPEGQLEAECAANARLIAAAPDLLRYAELEAEFSALCDRRSPGYSPERLMAWIDAHGIGDEPVGAWLARIRAAALARAKGQ